jgi:signal transduction histidine kinase
VADPQAPTLRRAVCGSSSYSPQTRMLVAERLLVAGLRAQERAEQVEAARERLDFLFRASQQLARSLEPATVLQSLVDLIVPEFGDVARLRILQATGRTDQTTMTTTETVSGYPPEWWKWFERVIRPAVRRARTLGQSESGCAGRRRAAGGPLANREISYLVVPLRTQGRTLGTLQVAAVGSRQKYGHEDLRVAEALANQAGLALDNARLYQEQRAVSAHLEQLRGQLDAAQSQRLREDERRRIARDLHDHVEQTFFAIGLTAASLLDDPVQEMTTSKYADALRQIGELSTSGAEQLRGAIFALKYTDAERVAIIPALWKLVRSFEQRTGVDTELVLSGPPADLPDEVAETLYAIAGEALANVERHAHAVSAVLNLRAHPQSITLTVHDDGVGAPSRVLKRIGSSATHFGLGGLRERVRRLNGHFTAGPGPDGGFILRTRLPLSSGAPG